MTLAEAERSIRSGSNAAFLVAGLTAVMTAIAMLSDAGGAFGVMNDAWNFLDVFLASMLAIGIRSRSRAAAVLMLLYFVLSKIVMSVDAGRAAGIGVGLVFAWFFGKSVQGTFAYHRIRRAEDATYRPSRMWIYILGMAFGVPLLALGTFSLLSKMGVLPQGVVVAGSDFRQGHVDLLRSEGVLEEGEDIVLFYSAGLFSILEDGNLLSDRRVITYQMGDEGLDVYSAAYSQIARVSFEASPGWPDDSLIHVWTLSGARFSLFAPTDEDGDKRFFRELEARLAAARK